MKYKHLLSLMLVLLIFIPMSGWGQQVSFDINAIKYEPSRLFPILSSTDIVGAPDDAIQLDAIKKISDRCRSRVPARFTPQALTDYCACSAATTLGTVTVGELRELQKETTRKLGNATFEKYVKNVVKPCMETPIEDIEYMFCITARTNDWRIKYPVPYCKCVSRGIAAHFKDFGLEEMMVSWGGQDKDGSEDPTDTLWDNNTFLKSRGMQKDQCVGSYMDRKNFR